MNAETKTLARAAYLLAFDNFAMNTKEIARELGIDPRKAYRILMKTPGLCDEMQDSEDGPISRSFTSNKRETGLNILWQCFETYDSHTREEAEAFIDRELAKE